MFANRFTPATSADPQNVSQKSLIDNQKAPLPPKDEDDNETASDMKAAQMGMFGKLTRTLLEWHPEKLLCKRFNIPDPYPASRVRGVPAREKKSKSSSYFEREFLSIEASKSKNDMNETIDEDEDDFTSKLNTKTTRKKGFKIGPLSHLNDQLTADSSDKGADSIVSTATSSVVPSQLATKTNTSLSGEKPSIDIFRAIFDNSDESSDSGDDEEAKTEADVGEEQQTESKTTTDEKREISTELYEQHDTRPTERKDHLHQHIKESIAYRPKNEGPLSFLNHRAEKEHDKIDRGEDTKNNYKSKNADDDYSNRSTIRERESRNTREGTFDKENDKMYLGDRLEDSNESIKYTGRHGNATKTSGRKYDGKSSGTEDEWSEKTERKKSKKKRKDYDTPKDRPTNHDKRSKRHDDDSDSDNNKTLKRKPKKHKVDKETTQKHKKDKKHRKKKSKRRKKEKYQDSKSSDSDSSLSPDDGGVANGNNESLVPSNAVLLAKLKQYKQATGKTRPSAADFM